MSTIEQELKIAVLWESAEDGRSGAICVTGGARLSRARWVDAV